MRQIISVVVASAMMAGGLWLAANAVKGIGVMAGVSLIIFGGIWLASDLGGSKPDDKG